MEIGNAKYALKLFLDLKQQGIPGGEEGVKQAQQFILRKAWRNDDIEEFKKLSADQKECQLPLARMCGEDALKKFAKSNEDIDGTLAKFSIMESTKDALLQMRKIPSLRDIAEGWIAILKFDLDKALVSFEKAQTEQPIRSKIGMGVVYALKGNHDKRDLLNSLRPFLSKKYPFLSKLVSFANSSSCYKDDESSIVDIFRNGSKKELIQLTKIRN